MRARAAIWSGVFLLLYLILASFCTELLKWAAGYLSGLTIGHLLGTAMATALSIRIFTELPFSGVGAKLNRASLRNVCLGIAGGAGCALLVILIPVALHLAHIEQSTESGANWRTALFFPLPILAGAAAEELLFHGFAFQLLLRAFGTWSTVIPVGMLFGLLHNNNPNPTNISLMNTAGFGILFGYAFLRSKDLWLPVGLHFGWNVMLPLLGADLSGLILKPTGLNLIWNTSPLISGGNYGPEASLLTTGVLFVLLLYLVKAPVATQDAPLLSYVPPPPLPMPEEPVPLVPKTESNSFEDFPPSTRP